MNKQDNFYNSIIVKSGFLLHKKFSIHILVLLILNFLSAIIVVGFFNFITKPLITYKISAFILFIIVATLLEIIIKMFVLRHFISLIFKTFGTITFLIQGIIFYLSSLIVNHLEFNYIVVINVAIFSLIFLLIRLMLIIVYQKYVLKHMKKEN